MVVALDLLSFLNVLNNVEDHKVPYDTFYLPEIRDVIDVRMDYVRWLSDNGPPGSKLFFCNYPFLFDAEAKTSLLQTNQSLQVRINIHKHSYKFKYVYILFNVNKCIFRCRQQCLKRLHVWLRSYFLLHL